MKLVEGLINSIKPLYFVVAYITAKVRVAYQKTNYQQNAYILRITKARAKLRYSKDRNEICCDFKARFCHKFNSGKSTCFKVISQAFLDDANVWSDIGEKPCFNCANEFAD